MATILALEQLFDSVKARFAADGATALAGANRFGWRTPPGQLVPATRIEWVPGDPSGVAGELAAPRWPNRGTTPAGATGRPLATLHELFTVYLHGFDAAAPQDERAQWKATRLLYDAWIRAVYLAAHGTVKIRSTAWLINKNEMRFGATLRVIGAIESMIPDSVPIFAPEVGAEIASDMLSATEDIVVEAAEP